MIYIITVEELELDPDEGLGVFQRLTITYGLGEQHGLCNAMKEASVSRCAISYPFKVCIGTQIKYEVDVKPMSENSTGSKSEAVFANVRSVHRE